MYLHRLGNIRHSRIINHHLMAPVDDVTAHLLAFVRSDTKARSKGRNGLGEAERGGHAFPRGVPAASDLRDGYRGRSASSPTSVAGVAPRQPVALSENASRRAGAMSIRYGRGWRTRRGVCGVRSLGNRPVLHARRRGVLCAARGLSTAGVRGPGALSVLSLEETSSDDARPQCDATMV